VLGLVKWDHFAVVLRAATHRCADLEMCSRRASQHPAAHHSAVKFFRMCSSRCWWSLADHGEAILLEAALSFLRSRRANRRRVLGVMIAEGKDSCLPDSWDDHDPRHRGCCCWCSHHPVTEGLREALRRARRCSAIDPYWSSAMFLRNSLVASCLLGALVFGAATTRALARPTTR